MIKDKKMPDLSPAPQSIEWALRRQSHDFRSAMASDPIFHSARPLARGDQTDQQNPQASAFPAGPEPKNESVKLPGLPSNPASSLVGKLRASAKAYSEKAQAIAGSQAALIGSATGSFRLWVTSGSLMKRALLGTAALVFVALPTAAMATHLVAPQLTAGLVTSLAETVVDPERVAQAHSNYDCTVATRVAIPDSHPVFLRTNAECSGWKTVASPYMGQDEERLINALTVLEGPWTESFYAVGGLNWAGKIRGLFGIGGGSAPGLSVFEEIATDTTSPGWRGKLENIATAAVFFGEQDGPEPAYALT
jgi:hypothetical protein